MHVFFLCFLFFSIPFFGKETFLERKLELFLNETNYKQGTLKTQKGGYLRGDNFYLQSDDLEYVSNDTTHQIIAKGDLVLYKDGHLFVGNNLFYDFKKESGCISNARVSIKNWSLLSDKIQLNPDRSFEAIKATITSSDTSDIYFKIVLDRVKYFSNGDLSSSNGLFKIFDVPLLWIPRYSTQLKKKNLSQLGYAINWDAGQGPQISVLYNIYATALANLLVRGDYRYKRGPAGALEFSYEDAENRTKIESRNYLAYDTFYNDDNPNQKAKRFRLQGFLKKSSEDGLKKLDIAFDRISDKNMPQDFNLQDFEFNPLRNTYLKGRYHHDSYAAKLDIIPRINPYLGLNQKLPSLELAFRPLKVLSSPLLFFNNFNVAYYDYTYSNILIYPSIYKNALSNFRSVRFQSDQKFVLPVDLNYVKTALTAGFKTISYNKSPFYKGVTQGVFYYNVESSTALQRSFKNYTHRVSPYISYQGIYKPFKAPQEVYIFSLDDGFHLMNFIKAGVVQSWKNLSSLENSFVIDLYTLAFTSDKTYHLLIPKGGVKFESHLPSLKFCGDIRWNFNNQMLDFSNLMLSYTWDEILGFHLELRYRGPYDFRKCDHENFILDVSRPLADLYNSPLSDKRATVLMGAEIALSPLTKTQLSLHTGWGRKDEPGYTEGKIDLIKQLSTLWTLKLSYMYTTRGGSHFAIKLKLNN